MRLGKNSLPFPKAELEVYCVEVAQLNRELIVESLDYQGLRHSFLGHLSPPPPHHAQRSW